MSEKLPDFKAGLSRLPSSSSLPTIGFGDEVAAASNIAAPKGPRFESLELIGQGGMGEVWRVKDNELNRIVAMKIIDSGGATTKRTRFIFEAQATAQLEHPGVVPVYELGQLADGRFYYTMREIHGRELYEVIDELMAVSTEETWGTTETGWDFLKLMDAFQQVCETLAYAHARGVIHRDLKPANVMLGTFGVIFVVDWGLVKILDKDQIRASDTDLPTKATGMAKAFSESPVRTSSASLGGEHTNIGEVAGTKGFMSPEQAAGDTPKLGPASDVWALGAILYCILTGKTPNDEPDCRGALDALPRVPHPLAQICLNAMSTEIGDRPANAGELNERLTRWLQGAQRSERQRESVEKAEQAFVALPEDAQRRSRELLMSLVDEDGTPIRRMAKELDESALTHLITAELVELEDNRVHLADDALISSWDRMQAWLEADRDGQRIRHRLAREARAWARKGRRNEALWQGDVLADLQAWRRRANPGLMPIELEFTEASETEILYLERRTRVMTTALLVTMAVVTAMALIQWMSALNAMEEVVAAQADREAALRATEIRALSAEASKSMLEGDPREALSLLKALSTIQPGADDGQLARLAGSLAPSRTVGQRAQHTVSAWSSDGRIVATVHNAGPLRIWDAETGQTLHTARYEGRVVAIDWAPDNSWAMTLHETGMVVRWPADGGKETKLPGLSSGNSLQISPDGRQVLIAGGIAASVWTLEGEQVQAWPLHVENASATWSPDGSAVLIADGRLTAYDPESGAVVQRYRSPQTLNRASYSADGLQIAASGNQGDVWVYFAATGERRHRLVRHWAPVATRSFLDYDHLLTASHDHEAILWDLKNGRPRAVLEGHSGPIWSAAVSPDARWIATGGQDSAVRIWDGATGALLETLDWFATDVRKVAFTEDGEHLVASTADGFEHRLTPPILQTRMAPGCDQLQLMANLSPAADKLLSWGPTGGCLVNLESGDVAPLAGGVPRAAIWDGDGSQFATVQADSLTLWSAETGAPGEAIQHPLGAASKRSIAGNLLIEVLSDAKVRAWPLDDGPMSWEIQLEDRADRVQIEPGGLYIVHSPSSGAIDLWSAETGEKVFSVPPEQVSSLGEAWAVSNASHLLAVGDENGDVRIWNLEGEGAPRHLPGGGRPAMITAFSRDGGWMAAGYLGGEVRVWNLVTNSPYAVLPGGGRDAVMLDFSADNGRLLVLADYAEAHVWSLDKREHLMSVARETRGMMVAANLINGDRLMTRGAGGVMLWPLPDKTSRRRATALSNLRVCRGTYEVVPVMPYPDSSMPWASDEQCR